MSGGGTTTGDEIAAADKTRPTKEERRREKRLRRHRLRNRSNFTLGEVMERTSHAGFGFLTAFLALVALPLFGISLPFGLAIAFLGAQMVWGRERPWLPKRLLKHKVSFKTIHWLSARVARWTQGLEHWVRPRWSIFFCTPSWSLVGVAMIVLGAGLALPLPIPGSNWIFLLPLLFFAFGLLEDDGVLLLVGFIATATLIVSGIFSWPLVWHALEKALTWLHFW